MTPKHKSRYAEGKPWSAPFKKKVKVINLRKENHILRLVESTVQTNLSETVKALATVYAKCLVKIEKALHLWMKDVNWNTFQSITAYCSSKH
jgi:hypothetical protein